MHLIFTTKASGSRSGQALPAFVCFIVVLILMVGLGIDLGFAYITKAQLSKAVDAACLAGIANLSQGTITASAMASSTFKANYGTPGRDTGSITPTVTFGTSSTGDPQITVAAHANINTFFVRVLPQWKTLTVSDSAQATRARLIMTLVLDRSESMDPNCTGDGCTLGGQYLPSAVAGFINIFDDNVDEASMVSFASTAVTNVAMGQPFKSKIITAANQLIWAGGTFSPGGLTNALAINNGIVVPTGQDAVKVVIFFTDGQTDMLQDTLSCPTGVRQSWNYGGYISQDIGFWPPNASTSATVQNNPPQGQGSCNGNATFPSVNGGSLTFTVPNVLTESQNRCIQYAGQMRAAGMYVYAVGLSVGTIGTPTATFLQQVANDPASPTYNPNLPVGVALVAGNGTQLPQLFQQVASDILLRLTQ